MLTAVPPPAFGRASKQTRVSQSVDGVASYKTGACGRKKLDRSSLLKRIAALPLCQHMTQQCIAEGQSVSRFGIRDAIFKYSCRVTQGLFILPHQREQESSTAARNQESRARQRSLHFSPMYNAVHVVEKWFNEDKNKKVLNFLPGETVPYRERKGKLVVHCACQQSSLPSAATAVL
ncbi:hypothetical protein PF010_g5428 [Phytophthora fragariae]|nr:hypothetical protein PF011_g5803 [Phytophthora fragariae]KAE9125973.1 hypothetical protein PF010_g5428 [Phytophthora fragariae]KAE9149914.1 hypothetical protein PF006_g5660 [Phytophthora fragariae]KAE9310766.1 hypothetical protein PF001_g10045 [Phytophthora fragariae]